MTFEVAHALYTEEPVQVYYLDPSPIRAAEYHCDRHVLKGILDAAVLLSTAWHELHNPNNRALDEPGDYDPAFRHVVPPPRGQTWDVRGADPFYSINDSRTYWTLCGQKVLNAQYANHPVSLWVRAAEGNYAWVQALGTSLCAEHYARFRRRHALEPVLWTLEIVPPALEGPQTEPPPVMPEHCKVEVDGYWDAVASFRNYYAMDRQPLLQWTRQSPPPWLTYTGERYEVA